MDCQCEVTSIAAAAAPLPGFNDFALESVDCSRFGVDSKLGQVHNVTVIEIDCNLPEKKGGACCKQKRGSD